MLINKYKCMAPPADAAKGNKNILLYTPLIQLIYHCFDRMITLLYLTLVVSFITDNILYLRFYCFPATPVILPYSTCSLKKGRVLCSVFVLLSLHS